MTTPQRFASYVAVAITAGVLVAAQDMAGTRIILFWSLIALISLFCVDGES